MTVPVRTLIASICATAVLGGSIGALATAATSSQASPASIAAAVQKVKDSAADAKLAEIAKSLRSINVALTGGDANLQELGIHEPTIHKQLEQICLNTAPSIVVC